MALSHRLEFRQTQSLVMTPQLMHAIKLLQLSNLDLVAYVDAELERNPLLERGEGEEGGGDAAEAAEPAAEQNGEMNGANGDGESDWLETRLETDPRSIEAKLDTDLANVFPDDNGRQAAETPPTLPIESWSSAPSRQAVSSEDYNLEAFVAGEKTLGEHLADQLGLAIADPTNRLVGQALINEIDETGYLRADLAAIGDRLGASPALVESVLQLIQTFEPTGVGARDLAECLAIQL